ncbi:MAG: PIN domain-containing protein [Deltaproteobacteria bacterium]|nr:PIN domain-containing protein [Deltaproteobacteria bacterium]
MIAADTSSIVAYIDGDQGEDTKNLDALMESRQVALPPPVLAELLSEPHLPPNIKEALLNLVLLEITSGYWERAGHLRAKILAKGLKARLADTLIAQSCLDHDIPLITRDPDFRHFKPLGLKLLP